MKFFAYLGAISCISLYWFDGDNIEFGILAFSQITFSKLPENIYKRKVTGNIIFKGYKELGTVLQQL